MGLIHEVQYAARRLRSSPMFTIAATLTLAIAIGATASVFGLVDDVLLKAFPYRAPDRVLTIWESNAGMHLPRAGLSAPDFLAFRDQNHAFTALAASSEEGRATVSGRGEPERVTAISVTPSYFGVLGVTPLLGRALAPDSSSLSEIVISYGYWQRRFGAASAAVGRTLVLDDAPYTIVGVMPPGLPGAVDLWARLSFHTSDLLHRDWHVFHAYGRLRLGATPEGAQSELETVVQRLAVAYPQTLQGWSALTVPLLDQLVGKIRLALLTLLASAGCVLLIGAANLANLFLVRGLSRQRELALRTALGATRGRLVRELLAEAVILGVVAGTLGVGVAVAGVRILRALTPPTMPRLAQMGVDGRVVAFCALTSLATVFVFGVLPAWQTSRGNLASFLKEGGRGTGSARNYRLQDGFVVLQVGIALVLLTGAGLLLESFNHFRRTDPGFAPAGVLTAQFALPDVRYPAPNRSVEFARRVVEQLAAQPGVEAASISSALPGGAQIIWPFAIVGDPAPGTSQEPLTRPVFASQDYFRTMGIAVRRGRGIVATDDDRSVKVAVIDERLARRYFAGHDPIGQRIVFQRAPDTDTVEVVGVVASVEQGGIIAEDLPVIYLSLAQSPLTWVFSHVAVRTATDPAAQTAVIRRLIASVDRTVPVYDVQTMNQRVAESVGTTRFSTFLASLFAVVALVLGVVGIYSVLAYIVSQRQREIAVRIALGASRANVMTGVLQRALVLTGTGIALGSLAAWMMTSALAGLFLGVSPHDPTIFAGAATVFALVALIAASIPAFRTTRVNPVVALASS